jgi:hypothetical protein
MTPTDQLRVQLLKANNTSYNAIDSMMKKIAKEHNITTTKLHKDFVKRYKMIPDAWIKKVNIEEDAPCWKDYKQVGTKKKNGKTVPNCVPKKKTFVEFVTEASAEWQRKKGKNPEGGLNKKGIASYRKQHPGSKLSLAVTTPPSK